MESRPRNDSLLSLPSIAHDETTSPAQEIAPWSHPVAQFVSLGTCDGTNEFIANPCYPLRPPDQTPPARDVWGASVTRWPFRPPACSEFRDWLRHQVQSGRCSKTVSVQPGGCCTGDDWLIHQFSSPEGVKLDQDGLPSACLLPLARLRFDTSASAPVRLHQNPGPFSPSTMVGFYGGSSPPLTMADMHGAQIMKFHRAYRHTVSAVRHEQSLPQHMPGTHELLGLSRTEKPLPGWFPEVPGHLQQTGTSRYIAVTAGTRPRFDGIKSFGITWVPNGLGKTDSHPMAA
ncbi:hypothetical protein NEUTE1DRAFT_100002 [Neurospora tetrasperma FGSC 2508]|uniref:Uncharacterized protein n=1 Tax=Neurospora tetrasperma (strain FGSC 2508 / ATCC MYA-4615 / P0657) TaxID=510951 RepID=F8MIV9_NEUT8|nr:uncharacterized protein NEUTE1DRAFT_100002 [Neurospora tetrasperma FGSC 2508]EGO59856.1 hypothetical protein NEUTE1DRAFT_100002 [Neurospora tetrasperma FGSC 2508]